MFAANDVTEFLEKINCQSWVLACDWWMILKL